MKPKISACATVQRHVDSIPLCEALDYVGLIFLFRIDTASVTALTQISASMVVPSSPTIQSLMRRPSRAKKASALNRPVSPSPENIRGVSGAGERD